MNGIECFDAVHEDLRTLPDAIVERGAPASAVHVREVVLQVFRWAIERVQKVENPAESVRPTSIAKFEPRDRALTPDEIGQLESQRKCRPSRPRRRLRSRNRHRPSRSGAKLRYIRAQMEAKRARRQGGKDRGARCMCG
jgi:hypothetical protein